MSLFNVAVFRKCVSGNPVPCSLFARNAPAYFCLLQIRARASPQVCGPTAQIRFNLPALKKGPVLLCAPNAVHVDISPIKDLQLRFICFKWQPSKVWCMNQSLSPGLYGKFSRQKKKDKVKPLPRVSRLKKQNVENSLLNFSLARRCQKFK